MPKTNPAIPNPFETDEVRLLVRLAVREDVGSGDVTTDTTIAANARACADIVAREPGIVAGLPIVALVLQECGGGASVHLKVTDGDRVSPGTVLAVVEGPTRCILAAERTVLNFLQRLSGVATLTHAYVDAVAGTNARIYDTRKTTPGWRTLEKYAVRTAGGCNHRLGLYDEALIKDNHLAALRTRGESAAEAAAKLRAARKGLFIEIEAEDEAGVREALAAGADAILLDNMTPAQMAAMVKLVRSSAKKPPALEASGGITLETVRAVAESGVDRISVGALTHSAPALDIAMDFQE